VVDNLNTHQSETLVRYVAAESDLTLDLGIKGKRGILSRWRHVPLSWVTRAIASSFTTRPSMAPDEPGEIWLSILARKLLKRGNFTSLEDLKAKILPLSSISIGTHGQAFQMDLERQGPGSLTQTGLRRGVLVLVLRPDAPVGSR